MSSSGISPVHNFNSNEGFFKAKDYLCKFIYKLQFSKQFPKYFNFDLYTTHLCTDL